MLRQKHVDEDDKLISSVMIIEKQTVDFFCTTFTVYVREVMKKNNSKVDPQMR